MLFSGTIEHSRDPSKTYPVYNQRFSLHDRIKSSLEDMIGGLVLIRVFIVPFEPTVVLLHSPVRYPGGQGRNRTGSWILYIAQDIIVTPDCAKEEKTPRTSAFLFRINATISPFISTFCAIPSRPSNLSGAYVASLERAYSRIRRNTLTARRAEGPSSAEL